MLISKQSRQSVKQSPRPLAESAVKTRHTQPLLLTHIYLPTNHLDWWTARPPAAGAVTALREERYRALLREFHANIATVAGDDVDDGNFVDPYGLTADTGIETAGGAPADVAAYFELYPMRRASWHTVPEASAVQPAPEFRIRHAVVDGSVPRFANLRFVGDATPRRVIVSVDRNVIWIDFALAQRAVALQAGFAGGPDAEGRERNRESFRLEAWRSDGSLVGATTGGNLTDRNWASRGVELLALRDDRADIRTVRFSHEDVAAFTPDEALFVYRVWHEPLPAAVVRQGTVTNFPLETFVGHQHRDHPDLPAQPADPPRATYETPPSLEMAGGVFSYGIVDLPLPFGCDRAAVFLRGFKIIPGVEARNRREPQPQKFSRLRVSLVATQAPSADNRRISFRLDDEYSWGEEREERGDALVAAYWSVLAWHSDRAELFRSFAFGASNFHPRKNGHSFSVRHDRPLADAGSVAAGGGPDAVYGQLFGGLTSYNLTLPRPVEPQIYAFAVGSYGQDFPPAEFFDDDEAPPWEYIISALITGGSVGAAGLVGIGKLIGHAIAETRLSNIVPLTAPLAYAEDGTRIGWSFVTNLDETLDRDERASTQAGGMVLSGRSINAIAPGSAGVDADGRPNVFVVTLRTGARAREDSDEPFNAGTLDIRLDADQAIAVMGTFDFVPEDEVRELDVEVRGAHYDGKRLLVALGSGVEITPANIDSVHEPDLVAAGAPFYDITRDAIATPHVAGISRIVHPTRVVLAAGHAEFDWVAGTRDDWPRTTGYLRNDGNLPIGIRSLTCRGHQPSRVRPAPAPSRRRLQSRRVRGHATGDADARRTDRAPGQLRTGGGAADKANQDCAHAIDLFLRRFASRRRGPRLR